MPHLFSSLLLSLGIASLLIPVTLFYSALEAAAASVFFTDSQAFATAVVGDELFFLDFENFPAGPLIDGSVISPGVVFSSPEASNPSTVRVRDLALDTHALSDSGGAAPNNVGPLRAEFTGRVSSMMMILRSASEVATITLFDSTDASIGQFATPSTGGFVGVVSDVEIASFELLGGLRTDGDRDRAPIDDFTAYGVVPELSTGLLLGTGLLGLAGWRRVRS